jgi:hypothetical protein
MLRHRCVGISSRVTPVLGHYHQIIKGAVEAFFVGSTVENFAFLSANLQEHEWLSRAVPYVVENHLLPYLHGETFLFLR